MAFGPGLYDLKTLTAGGPFVFFSAAPNVIGFYLASPHVRNNASVRRETLYTGHC